MIRIKIYMYILPLYTSYFNKGILVALCERLTDERIFFWRFAVCTFLVVGNWKAICPETLDRFIYQNGTTNKRPIRKND